MERVVKKKKRSKSGPNWRKAWMGSDGRGCHRERAQVLEHERRCDALQCKFGDRNRERTCLGGMWGVEDIEIEELSLEKGLRQSGLCVNICIHLIKINN